MPRYNFVNLRTGQVEGFYYSLAEIDKIIANGNIAEIDGDYWYKDFRIDHAMGFVSCPGSTHLVSDNLGVHPADVSRAMADAKRAGIRVEFQLNRNGTHAQAVFDGVDARKRRDQYAEFRGMFDKDSFSRGPKTEGDDTWTRQIKHRQEQLEYKKELRYKLDQIRARTPPGKRPKKDLATCVEASQQRWSEEKQRMAENCVNREVQGRPKKKVRVR